MSNFWHSFNLGFAFGMLRSNPMFSCFNYFNFMPSFSFFSYPMMPPMPNFSSVFDFNFSNNQSLPTFYSNMGDLPKLNYSDWDFGNLWNNPIDTIPTQDNATFKFEPIDFSNFKPVMPTLTESISPVADAPAKTETASKNYKPVLPSSRKELIEKLAKHLEMAEGKGTSTVKGDRGGTTNTGVTHGTYDTYRAAHNLPKQHVSKMTREEYYDIINWFWEKSGASKISDPVLAFYVFAMDWGSGFGHGKKMLAKAGNNPDKFEQLRIQFYDNIVKNDPSQKKFQDGWHNRVARDKKFAYATFTQQA